MRYLIFSFILLVYISNTLANDNEEFRATWVITWHHINSTSTVEEHKARVRRIMDEHKRANMNAVIWQVRQSGTVYYPSQYEPWGYYAGYQYPGYDHLAYAVEEAHKRGLEFHAWFNVFSASSTYPGTPAEEHSEWICRDQSGIPMSSNIALSPGLEAVRDYTLKVAMEVVNNYDIDGLHLDYIRWNEYTNTAKSMSFAKEAAQTGLIDGFITEKQIREIDENQSGRYLYDVDHPYSAGIPDSIDGGQFPSWEDWWRWSVTEFVKTLHDSIKTVKPWVRLSPAALGKYNWSGWNGYYIVYQDAALWFNEGYIDQLMTMSYHWTTGSEFYNMLEGDASSSWGPHIRQGIETGRLFSVGPGSYILQEKDIWYRHKEIVVESRKVPWLDGFQFFSYGSWYSYQYWDEAAVTFFNRKTKMRAAKYLYECTPQAPSISLNRMDSLQYVVSVTPPEIAENQWFIIYRSEDDQLSPDQDDILVTKFSSNAFTFTDLLSGNQDFNGKFTYYATMLDRYWNESEISNTQISDSIPSFAPVVVASTPAQGDTVSINPDFAFEFSKTMNINSVAGNIIIQPSVNIINIKWSFGDKKLTFDLEEALERNTEYSITLKKEISDINGRLLDGNGDGIEGDDFVLNLVTQKVDKTGPVIISSNPDINHVTTKFDVNDVITIAFDELVDHESVTESSVYLMSGEQTYDTYLKVFDYENMSVISLQGVKHLDPARSYTLTLTDDISDTTGNRMDSTRYIIFETEPFIYIEETMIENFSGTGVWMRPGWSGSTNGVDDANSFFEINSNYYVPASTKPLEKKSGELYYIWNADFLNPAGSKYLLREYLNDSPPRNVVFDTSYTLQCYVFGDGSNNKFRFCLDEGDASSWPGHEVSNWTIIDWIGWRLVEWKLSDPESVGEWIGNGILDGSRYRFDSFQLTHESGDAVSGRLFFENLKVIKKEYNIIGGISNQDIMIRDYELFQNYPNPFNAQTTIKFNLVQSGFTSLLIYDILGRKVKTLAEKNMSAGAYSVTFNANDLASGLYIYELRSGQKIMRKKMMLVK